ncbi:MAG TPA: hypothetical protein VGP80_14655 [Gemmatimonadales bacterium]|jgi:hypothetical protein|nr:hypothetical protein [Gemmatimonadales bacterium]
MRFRLGIVVGLAALAGCSSSDSNDVEVADLAGTYTATKLEFVSVADASVKFDAIAAGITVDLVITSGGGFTLTVHSPGDPDDVTTGTVVLDGNKITLDDSDPSSGSFTLSGNTLTLHLTTGAEFDFDSNGTDDAATVNAVFVRT